MAAFTKNSTGDSFIGPWWLESDDDLKTQVMWSPAPRKRGSLWSQERRSEGLSLYSSYGKEIQSGYMPPYSLRRPQGIVRKTGDGWWQLFVNNLISGSSAVSLFHPPHFFVNMFKLLRLLSMHGFSSFSKVPTVDSRRSRPRGVA